ncbi:MAG: hypothetical protein AVDCRST_MAG76-697, partial [uncultured Acidimicrobiales bacterium]
VQDRRSSARPFVHRATEPWPARAAAQAGGARRSAGVPGRQLVVHDAPPGGEGSTRPCHPRRSRGVPDLRPAVRRRRPPAHDRGRPGQRASLEHPRRSSGSGLPAGGGRGGRLQQPPRGVPRAPMGKARPLGGLRGHRAGLAPGRSTAPPPQPGRRASSTQHSAL